MARTPKILVAYDGSDAARAAIDDLARAAVGPKADVRVLSVADTWAPALASLSAEADGWYAQGYAAIEKQSGAARKQAKAIAAEGATLVRKRFPGWKVSARDAMETPAEGLLSAAESWKPSLIVLGATGRTALSRMLLGSVSRKVLTHATCGVRVARKPRGKRQGAPKLLVAVDGSPASETALKIVLSRQWPAGTSVRIVVVVDYRMGLALNFKAGAAPKADAWKTMARRIGDKAAERLRNGGLTVTTSLREGDPRGELLRAVRSFRPDTLFMGSRGHGPLQRFLLGGTSLHLAEHAPCSVEIAR